jgi:histidine triad (HIT) family protein
MMTDCIFCRIAQGEIPADKVYEDSDIMGFRDLNPQAPVHILLIPKRHIATLDDLEASDADLVGQMFLAAQQVARDQGIAEQGYRTLFNCNPAGGQEVYHLHLHLLGGRQMTWPPG